MSDDSDHSNVVSSLNTVRYQGWLLKKRKYLGFKSYWVVLTRGHIIYYKNEKAAQNDRTPKGTYCLNNAIIKDYPKAGPRNYLAYSFTIYFSNCKRHTLCAMAMPKNKGLKKSIRNISDFLKSDSSKINAKLLYRSTERKEKWIKALKENIEFCDFSCEPCEPEYSSTIGDSHHESSTSVSDHSGGIDDKLDILNKDGKNLYAMLDKVQEELSKIDTNSDKQSADPNLNKTVMEYKAKIDYLKTYTNALIEDTKNCFDLQKQKDLSVKSDLNRTKMKSTALKQALKSISNDKNSSQTFSEGSDKCYDVEEPSDETSSMSNSESDAEYFDTAEEFISYKRQKSEKQLSRNIISNQVINSEEENVNENEEEEMKKGNSLAIDNEELKDEPEFDAFGWRRRLPAKQLDRSQISIWAILKHCIGRELTKMTMPVFLCEPLTFLQRISENAQYSYMLNKALEYADDPCKRIECIAAFAASPCSSIERLSKPFNPMLGETYELVREDLGFKLISEQVSHHPPVTAFHVDSTEPGKTWHYYGSVQPKIKFWGKSIQVDAQALLTVEIPGLNETYTWRPITCTVHNIIIGTMWFEFSGKLEVVCHQTGYKAILNFHPYTWSNKELNKVDGYIYDNNNNKKRAMYGYWTHCYYSCEADSYDTYVKVKNKRPPVGKFDKNYNKIAVNDQKLGNKWPSNIPRDDLDLNMIVKDLIEVWTIWPAPPYAQKFYNFSYFTMSLNQMKPEFEKLLAPTDSRFRSDLRQLELGNLDQASVEKCRLEDKQREGRKKDRPEDYKGTWFHSAKHPFIDEKIWLFDNKYWNRDFSNCPDLF